MNQPVEPSRIYVVTTETVQTPEKGTVEQGYGRMAAQAGHAVSRMKMHLIVDAVKYGKSKPDIPGLKVLADTATTLIIKSCRDSLELQHVIFLLEKAGIRYFDFKDENRLAYGEGKFITALSTLPMPPEEVEGVLDYLPLFASEFLARRILRYPQFSQ